MNSLSRAVVAILFSSSVAAFAAGPVNPGFNGGGRGGGAPGGVNPGFNGGGRGGGAPGGVNPGFNGGRGGGIGPGFNGGRGGVGPGYGGIRGGVGPGYGYGGGYYGGYGPGYYPGYGGGYYNGIGGYPGYYGGQVGVCVAVDGNGNQFPVQGLVNIAAQQALGLCLQQSGFNCQLAGCQ